MKNLTICVVILMSFKTFAGPSRDLEFNGQCDSAYSATISFVGDILIHRAIYQSTVNGTKDFSTIWKATNSMIQKADFSVANLEGPAALGLDASGRDHGDIGFVYDGKVYSGTNFVFNFHPQIAEDLKKSGYDLISFANNHSLDRGPLGVDRTLEALRESGLYTSGARASGEGTENYYSIVNVKGINVAFLACTEMLNGRVDRKEQILNCFNGETEKIIEDLNKSDDVDFIVVMPHWGYEDKLAPNDKQKSYAKKFAEAGAGAIIGSHPHVPQPWEKYITTKGHEVLIAYSLGNFVAWQKGINNKTGPIVYMNLVKDENRKAKIASIAYSLTQRQGSSVYSVGRNNSDFIKNAKRFFGVEAFLLPDAPLSNRLCQ